MKKCIACQMQVEDQAELCPGCGGEGFEAIPNPPTEAPKIGNGDVLAGAVGAVLFALLGGLLYFLVYQLGIIAGICGLVIFVLAHFGYGLFAGTRKNPCTAGIVISILASVLIIFLAEYLCISFEIFKANKDWGITFFDAITATPEFLSIEEVRGAVIKDLIFAYGFGILASFSYIKALKNSK